MALAACASYLDSRILLLHRCYLSDLPAELYVFVCLGALDKHWPFLANTSVAHHLASLLVGSMYDCFATVSTV